MAKGSFHVSVSMDPRHFHIASTAEPGAALSTAMASALQWLRKRDAHELALALAGKDQLSGMLAEVLGAEAVRSLDRDNAYVRKGITLYLLTPKIQRRRMQGPVVTFGIEPDRLEDVVAAQGVTDVVYVPTSSAPEDMATYLTRYPQSETLAQQGALDWIQDTPLRAAVNERSSAPPASPA
ncbi:MAG: hypothetical protein IV094_25215 [Vitreoscilla sp.]|jgi:hypothetical protein|nr:hypothetical protein [Vitreoscilla sp.]